MRFLAVTAVSLTLVLLTVLPAGSHSLESFEFSVSRPLKRQLKWPNRRITVALSTSLTTPGPNFKLGSDVVGAARRAISRWSRVANINFIESSSTAQSISSGSGDGISLITIADTRENNAIFSNAGMTGRTRVFFDPDTGSISEADICINPHPALSDGTPVQFSTDGTPGTYDLESTFAHEIGHLLGLDHSVIWASTMQARQGLNGVYGLPALTGRTVSEEDLERLRSLYSISPNDGVIVGKVNENFAGGQIWIENIATGRVSASGSVAPDGTYRVDGVAPGQYRVLAEQSNGASDQFEDTSLTRALFTDSDSGATEISESVSVTPKSSADVTMNATSSVAKFLNPRVVGLNGDLSMVALPLEAGRSFKLYVGGEGIDQLAGTGITVTSPFFHVEPDTVTRETFKTGFPVVSFQLKVAPNTPFGDYTIRLQSTSGEIAFLPGSITIDPGVQSTTANPLDDAQFFVSQHYRDFLGRDPEPEGLAYWVTQLQQCGQDTNCLRTRRLGISNAFSSESEFQDTGLFIYGLFKTLGRRPTFPEFFDARKSLVETKGDTGRELLANQFVRRPEFLNKYPATMNAEQFVNTLLTETQQTANASLDPKRLMSSYDGTDGARAAIVQAIISNAGFIRAEYNRAYILMQYFAYFRRDPDEAGYNSWLAILQNKSSKDSEVFRGVSCGFLTSAEYQSRFGMIITHSNSECGR